MATIQNYLGEITGKMGGLVFQKNRSGSIIRTNRSPVKPYTKAGGLAKAKFGSSSKMWATVDADFKAGWDYYAQTDFRPKNYKVGKSYSGYNAFVSLKNQQMQFQDRICLTELFAGGVCDISVNPGSIIELIPNNTNPAVLYTNANVPVPITLNTVTFASSYAIRATFNYNVTNGTNPLKFSDPAGDRLQGFLFYVGAPNKKNLLTSQCFAFTGFMEVDTGWTTPQFQFQVSCFPDTDQVSKFKNRVIENQYVNITVMMVTNYGEVKLLGVVNCRVTDPF